MKPTRGQADPQIFVIQILMLAMMSSVGIFFFLAWNHTQMAGATPVENPQTDLFAIIAVISGAMSFLLPKFLTLPAKPNIGGKQISVATRLFVPVVLSFALSESVAVFGFLSVSQTRDFQTFIPFGITAILLMFVHRLNFLKKIRYEQKSSF